VLARSGEQHQQYEPSWICAWVPSCQARTHDTYDALTPLACAPAPPGPALHAPLQVVKVADFGVARVQSKQRDHDSRDGHVQMDGARGEGANSSTLPLS